MCQENIADKYHSFCEADSQTTWAEPTSVMKMILTLIFMSGLQLGFHSHSVYFAAAELASKNSALTIFLLFHEHQSVGSSQTVSCLLWGFWAIYSHGSSWEHTFFSENLLLSWTSEFPLIFVNMVTRSLLAVEYLTLIVKTELTIEYELKSLHVLGMYFLQDLCLLLLLRYHCILCCWKLSKRTQTLNSCSAW